jgi:hypothetical protein
LAILIDDAADALVVEDISLWALDAVAVGPGLAPEVVPD